jgi:hypothetical protein
LSYSLTGDNPSLSQEFSALLYSCGFIPASHTRAAVTIVVYPARVAAVHTRSEPIVRWRDLTVRQDGELIFFAYRSWDLKLDLTTLELHCWGPDPNSVERLGFREFFLLSPILFILHRLGYFETHAAACAHKESGYLFLGASGSGKTAAILTLIASGWSYLSDDAMLVCAVPGNRIAARPLRRTFSLRTDLLEHYPMLALEATEPVYGTGKRRLDPRRVWPDKYLPVIQPRFMISCKITNEEMSRIAPMPQADSLARLVASTPWVMFDHATAKAHLEVFRSLAASCCSFELNAGRDLFRDGNQLAALLDSDRLAELWQSSATKAETDAGWV